LDNFRQLNRNTKAIAAIAIFAALYSVIRLIPMGPMIGFSASFSVSDALAPIYGIILGPYLGGASVLLGTFLAMAMGKPMIFMGLDFLPAFVNVVAIGFLIRKKWIPALLLNLVLLAIFVVNPLTTRFFDVSFGSSSIAVPFFWLHIVALIVLISPLGYKAGLWVKSLKPAFLTVGVATLAFVGTMMQHLTGNILTEVVSVQLTGVLTPEALKGIWSAAFVLYPWERLAIVALSIIIGVPLVKALKTTIFPFQNGAAKKSNIKTPNAA